MFSHLIGNEEVQDRVRTLLGSGRLPNSLLFTGPDGVGKKHFALELARVLVCRSPNDANACGTCAACLRVGTFEIPEPTDKTKDQFKKVFYGEHLDVGIVVSYKRLILVDAIRDLESAGSFRPYEAEARVFIVDDADKMNDAASNALLKTLEEPPSTTYIVLITSRPNMLFPTIRSRCQTIRFAPVSAVAIATLMRTERGLDSNDANLTARLANGSVARALDFDLDEFRAQREVQLANLERALVKMDRSALVRASEQMNDARNKDLYEQNLEILESLVRDIWLIKRGSDPGSIRNLDLLEDLKAVATVVPASRLADSLNEIELLRQALAVNINRKIATDALFMKMST